jgi:hypothetical protein
MKEEIVAHVARYLTPSTLKINPDEVKNRIEFGHTCISFDLRMRAIPIHPVDWTPDKQRVLLISIDAWIPCRGTWHKFYTDMCNERWFDKTLQDAIFEFRCDVSDFWWKNVMKKKYEQDYSNYHVFGAHNNRSLDQSSEAPKKELIAKRMEELKMECERETNRGKKEWLEETLKEFNQILLRLKGSESDFSTDS